MRTAKKDGRLQLSGDPFLIRTLSNWLRIGMFAGVRPAPNALAV
jgi:hypothetical protein